MYTPVDIIAIIIPLSAVVFGIVFLFFFFLWRFKLKKKMIESGEYKDFYRPIPYRIICLFLGLTLTFASIPVIIISAVISGISYSLLLGLVPFSLGISFIFFYFIYFLTFGK